MFRFPRAVFAWNSANVEGWGLYAESIMQEHLPLEGQFFALYMRLLRAARSFLDPMLNVGMLTPQQAKVFLMKELLLSEPMAAQEIDRYTSWMPGQAPSYYYGLMKLQSLRTQTEILLGDMFDQLAFHDFILGQGLLPPELLRKAVLEEFVPQARKDKQTRSDRTTKQATKPPDPARDQELESITAFLREYIRKTLSDTGIPSISIALMKKDRIVWQDAFGYSNATLQVPATPDTVYAVASCFKPVTAMAVMQLIDKGLVELDDPVNKHLGDSSIKDLTDEGKTVTIRHLLSHHFGLSWREARSRAGELLEFARLVDRGDAQVGTLSGGMKRRLTIARALVNDPDLVLLDEPTTGLDPQARHLLWERLYQLKERGATLLLTTHYMDEAEQLADRLVVMDGGKIVAEGSPAGLIAEHVTREVLEVRFADADGNATREPNNASWTGWDSTSRPWPIGP